MSAPAGRTRLLLSLAATLVAAIGIQLAIDRGERHDALRAVRQFSLGAGAVLGEHLARRSPGGTWDAQTLSSWRGIVRVTYRAAGAAYAFEYDVPSSGIHPADPGSAAFLAALVDAAAARTHRAR